jgi:UDP-2,4-diacetamido-2,4,6-trideoxy-beta-L-altropyranose hydrolase
MRIAFRVDSGSTIGTGHLMRSLTLASHLQKVGHDCYFFIRPLPGHFSSLIKQPFHLITMKEASLNLNPIQTPHGSWLMHDWKEDAEETLSFLKNTGCDFLIVDHYALDHHWETIIYSHVKKLIAIDDLADRQHACHILIDMNFSNDNRYKKLTREGTEILIGLEYAVIRDEFLKIKERKKRTELKNILIFFGGSDHENFALKFLNSRITELFPEFSFNLLTRKAEIKSNEMLFPNLKIHVNPPSVAELMNDADLYIGSGGTITFERFYMGLPGLIHCVAPNQDQSHRELFLNGFSIPIDFVKEFESFVAKLNRLKQNPEWISVNSQKLYQLIDGKGHERILKKLFSTGLK